MFRRHAILTMAALALPSVARAQAWAETEAMLDRAKLRHMVAEDPGWGRTRR